LSALIVSTLVPMEIRMRWLVTLMKVNWSKRRLFKEMPSHSSMTGNNDPIPQYVITLAGVLEFTTLGGETFTIHPGDRLKITPAQDTSGD
jgi:hypothetical protein